MVMTQEIGKQRSKFVKKLNIFYGQNGIENSNFNCPHEEDCHNDYPSVWKGGQAHIGLKYADPIRIVVLSLDTGDSAESLKERTERIENCNDETVKLNPHMRGTKTTLNYILVNFGKYKNPFSHFAMLNASKCALKNENMNKAPSLFFENCREFAIQELMLLKPQVIITQGVEARAVLGKHCKRFKINEIKDIIQSLYPNIPDIFKDYYLHYLINKYIFMYQNEALESIVLSPVHPSERYGRWKQFNDSFIAVAGQIVSHLSKKPFPKRK